MVSKLVKKQVEDYYSKNRMLADYLAQEGIQPNSSGFISCDGHTDRTPSLSVDLNTDKWYCFGCGKGGGFIAYYALHNNISYDKAIDYLAIRLGFTGSKDNLIFTEIKRPNKLKKVDSYKSRRILISRLRRNKNINDIIEFLCEIQDSESFKETEDFVMIDEKVSFDALEEFNIEDFL